MTTTTTTEIHPFFCGSLLFSCSSAVIFIRFWVMILWKLSSGFSPTFSHALPICNTAYDSYPVWLPLLVYCLQDMLWGRRNNWVLSVLVLATICVLWEVHVEVATIHLVVLHLLSMFWAFLVIIKQFSTRQVETPKFSLHDYVFMVYT